MIRSPTAPPTSHRTSGEESVIIKRSSIQWKIPSTPANNLSPPPLSSLTPSLPQSHLKEIKGNSTMNKWRKKHHFISFHWKSSPGFGFHLRFRFHRHTRTLVKEYKRLPLSPPVFLSSSANPPTWKLWGIVGKFEILGGNVKERIESATSTFLTNHRRE